MKTQRSLSVMLAVVLFTFGCAGKKTESQTVETATPPAATAPAGEGHAGSDVVPGSHADWCDEHQVPETQCTRCDPSLIPAFQAASDWDAEHGVPLSQCTIHDPNLKIVRPPKPEGM